MNGVMWSLVTIVGPILLIVAVAWAFLRNRGRSRGTFAEAERGARQVRQDIDRDPRYTEDHDR